MAHDPLASGDLVAERRFAHAKAAARQGDFGAAAELFEQTLERVPRWAAAWFALGEAREQLGDLDAAADAFRAALAADPADAQGALARLALIGRADAPRALPEAYVARLFDDYAARFDTHLIKNLGYRGPALIADALSASAPGRRFACALDLGCGTGLTGEALRGSVDRLAGVDLSAAMIARARARAFTTTRGRRSGGFDARAIRAPSISPSRPIFWFMWATSRPCSRPSRSRSRATAFSLHRRNP